jgi:hypothetical protein
MHTQVDHEPRVYPRNDLELMVETEYLRGFNAGVDMAHTSPRARQRFLYGLGVGFGLGLFASAVIRFLIFW